MKHYNLNGKDLLSQKAELERFLNFIETKIELRNQRLACSCKREPLLNRRIDNSLDIKYNNTKERLRIINLQLKRGLI